MSARKGITVTREYKPMPNECARALALLLKRPVSNEGSPILATLNDTRGESGRDSRTGTRIP